jgi:hypothetical protein
MKYILLSIRKKIIFFLNISTRAAYIPAKLCIVRVIYLNNIKILNSYFKENTRQFPYKEKTFSAVQKKVGFSQNYTKRINALSGPSDN